MENTDRIMAEERKKWVEQASAKQQCIAEQQDREAQNRAEYQAKQYRAAELKKKLERDSYLNSFVTFQEGIFLPSFFVCPLS